MVLAPSQPEQRFLLFAKLMMAQQVDNEQVKSEQSEVYQLCR